jgi:hypothetical protein
MKYLEINISAWLKDGSTKGNIVAVGKDENPTGLIQSAVAKMVEDDEVLDFEVRVRKLEGASKSLI